MPDPILTDHYDQDPDAPYATCENCGETFTDQPAANAHREATLTAPTDPELIAQGVIRRSHTIRCGNPTRDRRINYAIDGIVEDELRELGDMDGRELTFNEETDENIAYEVNAMIRRGDITRDEAETALREVGANHITVALSEGDS